MKNDEGKKNFNKIMRCIYFEWKILFVAHSH